MEDISIDEKWVIGYENSYSIDESGNVYSFKKGEKVKLKPGAEVWQILQRILSNKWKWQNP